MSEPSTQKVQGTVYPTLGTLTGRWRGATELMALEAVQYDSEGEAGEPPGLCPPESKNRSKKPVRKTTSNSQLRGGVGHSRYVGSALLLYPGQRQIPNIFFEKTTTKETFFLNLKF